ncbi:surface protease GP63 [Trypanosoma cruzi]|nr:surface protease GP63 [Trypanosoma cruzi]
MKTLCNGGGRSLDDGLTIRPIGRVGAHAVCMALCSPATPLFVLHPDAILALKHFVFLIPPFFLCLSLLPQSGCTAAAATHTKPINAICSDHSPATPRRFSHWWCCCWCTAPAGCIVAAPALELRRGFDTVRRRGALQAYTVATQIDSSGWEPNRIAVSTEDLENTNKRNYCEEGRDECYNVLGDTMTCKVEHPLTE